MHVTQATAAHVRLALCSLTLPRPADRYSACQTTGFRGTVREFLQKLSG